MEQENLTPTAKVLRWQIAKNKEILTLCPATWKRGHHIGVVFLSGMNNMQRNHEELSKLCCMDWHKPSGFDLILLVHIMWIIFLAYLHFTKDSKNLGGGAPHSRKSHNEISTVQQVHQQMPGSIIDSWMEEPRALLIIPDYIIQQRSSQCRILKRSETLAKRWHKIYLPSSLPAFRSSDQPRIQDV